MDVCTYRKHHLGLIHVKVWEWMVGKWILCTNCVTGRRGSWTKFPSESLLIKNRRSGGLGGTLKCSERLANCQEGGRDNGTS